MAEIREILNDPDFKSLPAEEKRKVMMKIDGDFAGLAAKEQDKVLFSLDTLKPEQLRYSPELRSSMIDTGLSMLPAAGATAATMLGPAGILPAALMAAAGGAGGSLIENTIRRNADLGGPQTPETRLTVPLIEGAKMAGGELAFGPLGKLAQKLMAPNAAKLAGNPEAQNLLRFTRENDLPMSPSTILPDRLSGAVEGAINMFPSGKLVTSKYQNKLYQFLLDSRQKVINEMTGAETGSGKLAGAVSETRGELKAGVKEAYGNILPEMEKAASGDLKVFNGQFLSTSKLKEEAAGLAKRISDAEKGVTAKADVNKMAEELRVAGRSPSEWMRIHGDSAEDYAQRLSQTYKRVTGKDPLTLAGETSKFLPGMQSRLEEVNNILSEAKDAAVITLPQTRAYLEGLLKVPSIAKNKRMVSMIEDFQEKLNPAAGGAMDAAEFARWQATIGNAAKTVKDNPNLGQDIWKVVNADIETFDKAGGTALLNTLNKAKLDNTTAAKYRVLSGLFEKATTIGRDGQEIFSPGRFYTIIMNEKNQATLTRNFGKEGLENLKDYTNTAMKISEEAGKKNMTEISKAWQTGMIGGLGAAAVFQPSLVVPYGMSYVAAHMIMKPRGIFKQWLTEGFQIPKAYKTALKVGGRAAIAGSGD